MKIAVCVRHSSNLHKICWLNESRSGIYFGIFTDVLDVHMSYHTDGRRHTKIGDNYQHKEKSTPLIDFSGVKQLSHQAISVPREKKSFWPKHSIFKTWESMIVLDETQFKESEWLALDIWLFDSLSFTIADKCIKDCTDRDTNFRAITSSYHQLSSFNNLNLALAFRAAKNP